MSIEVQFSRQGSNTLIHLTGSNFGIGPFMSDHVKGQVGNLKNRIEVVAYRYAVNQKATAPKENVADGILLLERLGSLRKQSLLSEEEFQQAKKKLLGL